MKVKQVMRCMIGAFMGASVLFSCTSEDVNGMQDEVDSHLSTDFIATSNEQNVLFDIQYQVPEGYKVVFDVYAENPYNVTPEGFSKKKDVKPIISAMTDENGRYHISRVISSGVKEVYVASDVAGVPALMHGTIQGNNVAPVEFDMSSLIEEEEMTSRAAWNAMFLGGWNYWGRPNYIDTSKDCPISKRDLRAISAALPEWKTVNSNYTNENYIYVQKEAEVWISLLSEKSLFNNVLGYYCYTEGMTKDQIGEVVALPRANIALLDRNGLKYGEYVKLKYLNPKTKQLENKFPAGSRIGWVMHRSGYNCLTRTANKGVYQFYSDDSWNPERKYKDHVAVFKTHNGNVIVGMEDLYNETLLADNDCNDIVFHVTSSPNDAIVVNTEIPEAPAYDFVEEEVDVVQPLTSIVDVPENDALANDLHVASASKLQVVDGYVTGVKDVLYIAKSDVMNQLTKTIYLEDERARKVVVRTTIKVPGGRAAEAEEDGDSSEEKKGRTVVRTTIKNSDWEADRARSIFNDWGSVEAFILAMVDKYRADLEAGEVIKIEATIEFEGVEYNQFVESINVPPYSPFIKDIND